MRSWIYDFKGRNRWSWAIGGPLLSTLWHESPYKFRDLRILSMRMSNQAEVGLATVFCLVAQGYIFTYVLGVEPNLLVVIAPLLPYILFIYARGRRTWYFNKPIYWILVVIAVTLIDLAPYSMDLASRIWLR